MKKFIDMFRQKNGGEILSQEKKALLNEEIETYWTDHNVTLHRRFGSRAESLRDFHWRNDQYYRYIGLMPTDAADDLVVLDFGCGPGYDLVGFSEYSNTKKLIGVDVSDASLAEAQDRLLLHGHQPELIKHDVVSGPLPLQDSSVDLVHSSGVLHHVADLRATISELRRVLKRGGNAQIMVYHADSIWAHLYVAYERQLVQGIDQHLSLSEAFRRSTDGENCPVSNFYTEKEFTSLFCDCGFELEKFGVAVSVWEMSLLSKRFSAIMDNRLTEESRRFLAKLSFDEQGLPLARPGVHAGIDACFRFRAV